MFFYVLITIGVLLVHAPIEIECAHRNKRTYGKHSQPLPCRFSRVMAIHGSSGGEHKASHVQREVSRCQRRMNVAYQKKSTLEHNTILMRNTSRVAS
ncbi:hypothetical protein B0H14DRAFT_2722135 [Mycena olivaceomarginata]|nr:hypothetical protein B0H14DRAFT_2722135 [Mycena olivaceomarginata]